MNSTAARVLIIEDDPSWQALYRDIVVHMGYACTIVDNPYDALARLVRGWYHIVVVDLSLIKNDSQNLDGMKVLQWIRQMNEGTQALVSTGYAFPKSIRDIFKGGTAFDLVEKGADSRSEIEALLSKGVATAKQHMNGHFLNPSSHVKGLSAIPLEEALGIQRVQFDLLLDTTLRFAIELLDHSSHIHVERHPVNHYLEAVSFGGLPLIPDSQPARYISQGGGMVILRFWDRLFERCLMVRISRRNQVEREHSFFYAHPVQAQIFGFTTVSGPLYMGNFGSIMYVMEETNNLFSEFDHPWSHLLTLS
jgi:CheY-like chemotaxis protein